MFGMEKVPVSAWSLLSNVWSPVPAVKVPPLLVIPPLKVTGEFPELIHVEPEAIVTRPVNRGKADGLLMIRLPFVPPPIVEVLATLKENPETVNVVPSPIKRLPPTDNPVTVAVDAVPLKVRLPPTKVVPVVKVFTPLPERVRLL